MLTRFCLCVTTVFVLFAGASWAPAELCAMRRTPLFASRQTNTGPTGVARVQSEWMRVRSERAPFVITAFPLADEGPVDLVVEPFSVTRPATRFVVGRRDGADLPFAFDPSTVRLLRGYVAGRPGSHVLFAIADAGSLASIDPGTGRPPYVYASAAGSGHEMFLAHRQGGGSLPPGVALCGLDSVSSTGPPAGQSSQGPAPVRGMQVIQVAVETDYEFFQLFNDLDAAAAYVLEMFSAVSDIYIRDVNARVELSFVRLWDTPDDLFNEPDPLSSFRTYWNNNMTGVQRDLAQFVSGRRDLPYGGVAWLNALCSQWGYSVVGYILGFSHNTWQDNVWNYDAMVAAHELGHNCGTNHTHYYGIDDCDSVIGAARRGTIMSYCSQTRSGGNANLDVRFHGFVQDIMRDFITSVDCVDDDCNLNGVHDADDIAMGTSVDVDLDGIPDECEDCNANGVLDSVDISGPTSPDVNLNGIPDECEPDCNGNQIPDEADIFAGTSEDLHGNNVPDTCEPDCDASGVSDYNEILADMTRDINRDTVLDECEDCDADGTLDAEALGGAHNVWVAGETVTTLGEFHAASGVRVRTSDADHVSAAKDLVIAPGGNILVTSSADDRVAAFDPSDGSYLTDFVTAGSGGLDGPAGLTFGPEGNLFVSSANADSVLEYDGTTGAFVGMFVASGAGGLTQPFGLTFGPNGDLFVTASTNQVLRFDGATGGFLAVFVTAADNGGLDGPRGMTFKPDGNLLVASYLTDEVLEYDGETGAFVGKFNHNGTDVALTLDRPWGVRIGHGGNVFVSRNGVGEAIPNPGEPTSRILELHLNTTRLFEFDVRNGNFARSYVLGNDSGLSFPTGFDFVPGWAVDCNLNNLPDNCDIQSGTSLDDNANGIPDECEADCNNNGTPDRLDIIPRGASYDRNYNGIPDECEVLGDGDLDGDVDLLDYTAFFACMTDPDAPGVLPGCAWADLNQDNRVDARDFAVFQVVFTGG